MFLKTTVLLLSCLLLLSGCLFEITVVTGDDDTQDYAEFVHKLNHDQQTTLLNVIQASLRKQGTLEDLVASDPAWRDR